MSRQGLPRCQRPRSRQAAVYEYDVQAWDVNSDPLTFHFDVGPPAMQMDAHGRITWSPTESDVGAHYVQVSVADDHGGSVGQGFDLHVVLVKTKETNQSPQIISTPPLVIRVGESYRYDVEAVDQDRDALLWTLLTGPDGMLLDSQLGTLRWAPRADQVGSHDVSLRVTDGRQGLAAQSFEIRVLAADEQPRNAPPSITSLPKTEIEVGSSYGYDVRAWDPNGDPLTFHLDAGPPRMKIDPQGRITWSPAIGDVGTHYVQVTVADDRGAWIGQGYELNVVRAGTRATNQSPQIISTPPPVASVGASYQYQLEAIDPDGDMLIWSLETGPDSMSLDPQRGTLRWTPRADQVGIHNVAIQVADGQKGQASQSFSILVLTTNLPPRSSPRPRRGRAWVTCTSIRSEPQTVTTIR